MHFSDVSVHNLRSCMYVYTDIYIYMCMLLFRGPESDFASAPKFSDSMHTKMWYDISVGHCFTSKI